MRIVKYIVTGLVGISVNLLSLRGLVYLGAHVILASVVAFSIATCVGFTLQKFWTFDAGSVGETKQQFGLYAAVTVVNLGVNTAIVYVCVDLLHVEYLLAQAFAAGLVSVFSYYIYKLYIFRAAI